MSITDSVKLPPAVKDYYDRIILMTAYPNLIYGRASQKRTLPEKMGTNVLFRRYPKLSTVPIPLKEGVTPQGTELSVVDIKATVSLYGNYVTINDQVQYTVQDKVLNEAAKLLGQNMGQTYDEVTRDVLASTSSVIICSNGQNESTPTELTKKDIDAAIKTLITNDAKMISEVITGSTSITTTPIRPAFLGFIHSNLLDDLETVSNFVDTSRYSKQTILDYEWGATGNVRWTYTSAGSVTSGSPDVYNNIIVGKEASAVVNLKGDTGDFYIKPLGSSGSSDPLNQRGTVGWKHGFTARILNDSFAVNLMSSHS